MTFLAAARRRRTLFGRAARAVLGVVAVTLLSGHVAPSVDDNNRYLKVTPLRDGIRLAYTVFFGEIPGASERRSIDANRDGRIDEAEAQRFADKLGSEVSASIDIEIDGVAQRVQLGSRHGGHGQRRGRRRLVLDRPDRVRVREGGRCT
jgi:hypothetical protein